MSPPHESPTDPAGTPRETGRSLSPLFLCRAAMGGALMGLANLVPGISGGTMLLAAGVYPAFVEAVASVSRFARRWHPWLVLAAVAVPAVVAIGVLAGTVRDAVLVHRWIAYSLFIGLTLGGAPTLLRMIRPLTRGAMVAASVAFVAMIGLAILQESGVAESGGGGGVLGLGAAGFAGAAAMVLPGVSGGYLLLLLGQYVAVLDAISTLADAVRSATPSAIIDAAPPIVAIGIGVLLGIALVSNAVRWLLRHHREVTLGALLGLLLGAVAGLWPFREPVVPEVGRVIRGELIETTAQAEQVPLKHRPTRAFTPSPALVAGGVGLVLVGFAASLSIARIGRDDGEESGNEGSA